MSTYGTSGRMESLYGGTILSTAVSKGRSERQAGTNLLAYALRTQIS